jgi:cysteine synthase A
MIYNNLLEMVGNTPVIKLNNVADVNGAEVYVKLEGKNPGGSVKDRAALSMIVEAEKSGVLKTGMTIIEPTSGNTGISLAMIGRLKGYKVVIVMPETMSVERRNIIKAYGAELILTEGAKGMKGAIAHAEELHKSDSQYFLPQQFTNKNNSKIHYDVTAQEIIADFETLDAFVSGVGTGGTISGVGRRVKEHYASIQVVAVEPAKSAVISGNPAGPHKIQGIGAGFITDLYKEAVVDLIETVQDEDAFEMAQRLVKEEGLFLGISASANILVAIKIAKGLPKGSKVLTIAPDGGDKYISMGVFGE